MNKVLLLTSLLFLAAISQSCGESAEPVVIDDSMNCQYVYTGNWNGHLQCTNHHMVCDYDDYSMSMKCRKITTKGALDDME